jgi:broad specificity phosphatase PhoE
MTVTIHLVRHAAYDVIDRILVGRNPGVQLSALGLRQAQALAQRFASENLAAVQSSPQTRARQTAQPIADAHGLPIEIVPEMDELALGEWTGRSFAELEEDPAWRRWNEQRGTACPPQGESMRDAQARVLAHLAQMASRYEGRAVVIVSHAEPIRAAILHYAGRSLDEFNSMQVGPASVTELALHEWGAEINQASEPPLSPEFIAA